MQNPGIEPEPVKCLKKDLYKEWCEIIKDMNGPWSKCLKLIDQEILENIYGGCLFDLCATEQNPTLQNEYKCKAYEQIADICNDLMNSNQVYNWRFVTGCRKFFIRQ